jgi:hypothetical protein
MSAILTTALVVLGGSWLADRASSQSTTPLIGTLNAQASKIQRARSVRCLSRAVFRWHPGYEVPVHMRQFVIRQRAARLVRNRALPSGCELARAWGWHYGSAASCVRSREGGLTSVNPAGPYYGWYQTDPNCQAAYGPEFYRRWGPGIWPAYAQVLTAYRGWRVRGWQPWPNTARACGLLR